MALAASLCLLSHHNAYGDVTAISQLSFTNLAITPSGGSLQLLTNWQGSAFSQAGVNNQYNSGSSAAASSTGDYSVGNGTALAPGLPSLNVFGSGSANASILGQLDASDAAAGRGTVVNQFMITGGSGPVNVSFSTLINGSLNLLTDSYGLSADAETVFALQVDGNPILFNDQVMTISPNQSSLSPFSTLLSNSTTLQYNTVYQLYLEADAEAFVTNIPEPGAGALIAMGALTLVWLARKRAWRIFLPKNGAIIPLAAGALLFFSAVSSQALYIGADPPQICDKCGSPPNRQPGGMALTSLTEGNLREDFPVVTVQSGSGPTLQMTLTYNSYNADASRAQVDCGLGMGWTHSYNIFLFMQRGSLFRMGPDGRVTLFHEGQGGTYAADSGFFETLTSLGGGTYAITNKDQSWWKFASVPNTPFLVAGPVYRLIQMGDRNTNVTSLTYSNGLLTLITDTYGRMLRLGYTNQSKLATITDPLGRVTLMQYDPKYRTPIRITDPLGNVARYSYNSLYQMNRKIDRDGRTYLYLYKNQKPFAAVDGNGQAWFAESNTNNWAVDRNALAFTLRRVYVPSTLTNMDGNGNTWRYQYDTNSYITGVVAPDGSTTTYTYDSRTRLLSSATNANGAVTRYQYDTLGNRTNMTDALGNVTTYSYEPVFNQITGMTDPNGRVTTYQYDPRGNRTNEVDPLGQITRYTYDGRGNLLTLTDKRTNTTTYIYDTFGNRTNMTDPLGNVTTYIYDPVGNGISMTDPLGRTTRYQYDPLDRLIGTTNALSGVTTYSYDALGRQISVTDPNTNTTIYAYDLRGRLIRTTDALGGVTSYGYDPDNNQIASTNQLGHPTTYTYDSLNRVIGSTNAVGGISRLTYDPVGNRTSSTDPNTNTTTYFYDALNRQIITTNALGGMTRYDYSMPGGPPCCSPTVGSSLVTRTQDADGNVTFYHYDELDRRVQVVRKNSDTNDVINPTDAVATTAYDPVGNVIAVTDPVTNKTVYTFDPDNRRTSMVDAAGDTTITRYDADGNLVVVTAPNGNSITNIYDPLNRVIHVYDEIGLVITDTYDADGNRLTTTDPLGHTTSYQYDGLSRQVEAIDALGQTTTTVYDPDSNIFSTTDRKGRPTTYFYDGLDRRTAVTDALGNTTTAAYDSVGNVAGLTDANGHTTSYRYDALNRQVTATYPDALPNARTNVYDAVGNVISRTDQKGQVTTYSYNPLYFMTNRAYLPSGANDSFTYDLDGRMITADRNGWVDTFAYDGANRLTNTMQNGRTLTYTYNIPGRVQTNSQPSGRTLNYSYDARNRLVGLNDVSLNPPIVTYAYDAADRVTTRIYRNATTATYTYNANNWVISLEHSNSLGRITGFGYAYDNEGNKLFEQRRDNLPDSEAYAYDAIDRLTNYDVGTLSGSVIPAPAIAKAWNLDRLGNWNSVVSNGVPQVRTHGPANELLTVNASSFSYDFNGNLSNDTTYACTYDEENRLTLVQRLADSAIVGEYFYDALGRRVVKFADPAGTSSTNLYFYDDAQIVEEQNIGGLTTATYTFGNYIDEVLTMDRGGQTYYYHPNVLWSAEAVTDGTGNPVERYTYDAYGSVIILDGSYNPVPLNSWGTPHSAIGNPCLFTGRQLDEETGLYFYRARYYDPVKGRFLQRDPLGYMEGMNLYEYVGGDPLNLLDPLGLAPFAWDRNGGVALDKDTEKPRVTPFPVWSPDKKTRYGNAQVTVSIKNGAVDIGFNWIPNLDPKVSCPCGGKLGWVQHVTNPINGSWQYDNAAELAEREVVKGTVEPGRGASSTPGSNPKDFTKRPDKGEWKANPWYGGVGNVTAERLKKKEHDPKKWAGNPGPQTQINDTPASGARLAFITQLVCEGDGKVIFEYAWMQNVDTRNGKKYLFVGGRPFYGKEFGKDDSGIKITPGDE